MTENLQAQLEHVRRKVAQLEELRALDAKTHQQMNESIALLEGLITVARSKAAHADDRRQEAHRALDAAGVAPGGLVERIELLAGEALVSGITDGAIYGYEAYVEALARRISVGAVERQIFGGRRTGKTMALRRQLEKAQSEAEAAHVPLRPRGLAALGCGLATSPLEAP